MTLFSQRSFLVARPTSLANQRAGEALSCSALQAWLKNLSATGTILSWEENGARISWSQPHQSIIEAHQLDIVRTNFERLATLCKVKQFPCPIEENGSLAEDTSCYHTWYATQHLLALNRTHEEPHYYQNGLFEEAPSLDGLPLCFGDTETTGFAHDDRIIQLALVRMEPNEKVSTYDSYFNPEGRKNNGWSINKISDWRLKHAPYFRNEVRCFLPLLENVVFIAHNARFDQRFFTQEFSRLSLAWPAAHAIDTQVIAKVLWPKAPKHKLEVLAPWLGIRQGKEHDAKGDTETLIALWEAIRAERPTFTVSQWARMAS
jgi:hypothetical protein